MGGNGHLSPAQVHAKVKHPIIDGDGHWVEFPPVFAEKMRKVGGDKAADGFLAPRGGGEALKMTPAERTERRFAQPNFWNRQGENTLDRATAMMPKLLYERLDEIGSDFAVIYPTAGLGLPRIKDDETRRAVIRAYNIVSADYFRDFSDRMTAAAVIPMHTPEEAIEELEFVTKQLGSKVGMFGSNLPRPVPSAGAEDEESRRFAVWYDVLGIDSLYDYDPVWAKCVGARHCADLSQRQQQPGIAPVADELCLQSHRPFRRRRSCRRQGDFPRGRHPSVPTTQFRLS
jgi:hypothetical protein